MAAYVNSASIKVMNLKLGTLLSFKGAMNIYSYKLDRNI